MQRRAIFLLLIMLRNALACAPRAGDNQANPLTHLIIADLKVFLIRDAIDDHRGPCSLLSLRLDFVRILAHAGQRGFMRQATRFERGSQLMLD